MRSVSATALAKAMSDDGHESAVILELDTGAGKLYLSERDMDGTDPRIIEMGNLNANVSSTGATAGSVNVKLSDEDEYFLDLMCTTRLEGRTARILLIFDGDLSDPVELLVGRVGSPLVWEEDTKNLSFDVVAFYVGADKEVPFAPDETSGLQEFAWNQPWPRIYGTPVDVPAVLVVDAPSGTLTRELQPLYATFEIEVADNVEFPIGEEIEVDVGNERITGQFEVVRTDPTTLLRFHIQSRNVSKGIIYSQDRAVLEGIEAAPEGFGSWLFDPRYAAWDANGKILAGNWLFLLDAATEMNAGQINSTLVPGGSILYGTFSVPSFVGNKNYILYQKGNATRGQLPWIVPSGLYYISIGARADIRGVLDVNDTLWPAGTTVRLVTTVKYVASDLPAEAVLQVRAWREVKLDERGGKRKELVVVPPDFYTVDLNDNIADRACTTLEFEQPLSSRGAGWDDEVFVTLRSSYGPNVADIIAHLMVEAGLSVDDPSFDAVFDQCENYPMNFAVLDRKDPLVLAADIAFQGRCGMVVLGSLVFLKYLSLEPDEVVFTYNEPDTTLEGMTQLTSSETDEVNNDLWVHWHKRGSQKKDERLHYVNDDSIEAFGRRKRELTIFVYRHKSLVNKTAQFWFNRWSRVWRKLRVVGDLDAIAATIYDDVKSTLPELVTNAVIESLEHDTSEDQIAAMLWTPVEVGSCDQSAFAYDDDSGDVQPNDLSIDAADDVAEVIEVGPLDLSLSEKETHVGEALTPIGTINGVFNARLYKGSTTTSPVVSTSVQVVNLSDAPIKEGDIVVIHKAEDGTYYTVKGSAGGTTSRGGGVVWGIMSVDEDGHPTGFDDDPSPTDPRWNTVLTTDEEAEYVTWKVTYEVDASDEIDYDYRGAFKAGLTPDLETEHWPDTYKKPNHPTFSNESIYAYLMPHLAGSWSGTTFVAPDSNPDHYFRADLFEVSSAFAGTSMGSRFGRLVGGGSVYDGQVTEVNLASDGTAWVLPQTSPFGLALVRTDAADKDNVQCRKYKTADLTTTDSTKYEDITVKLPALQSTAKVSAGTWVIVMRVAGTWLGYIPLIRPRVVA